jgi:hypothetical protein
VTQPQPQQIKKSNPWKIAKVLFLVALIAMGTIIGLSWTGQVKQSDLSINQTNIISLSIIIDNASYFDQLAAWLAALNLRNFTFVVVEGTTDTYILGNATRVSILEQYGKIIPRLPYIQALTLSDRILYANSTLNEFAKALGYTPKGVMDFIPDTYTAQYLLTRGAEYYQGYCFDQYNIDYMTMRGGFQMPYYASAYNILCPSTSLGGMVVLPHSTWDWVASFTVSHNIQLHPMNLIDDIYNGNVAAAKTYFLSMIDNTFAGSSPFGYVTVQFEWTWCLVKGDTAAASDWIQTLLSTRPSYKYWDFEDAVIWFKTNYNQTPVYRIQFTSPYDGEKIEWYYDLSSRVARIDNNVVSYIDCTDQHPDKYLNSSATIIWKSPPNSTNGIDNSLAFKIDALGGGWGRAPVATPSVPYTGDLASFKAYYTSFRLDSSAHACSEIGLKWVLFAFHDLRKVLGFVSVIDFFEQLSS